MVKFKAIRKNDPNAVTFKLVSASQTDPRVIAAAATPQPTPSDGATSSGSKQFYIWQHCPRKSSRKDIPADLLNVLSPEDFGIHENLSTAERVRLCQEIYGTKDVPKPIKRGDGHEASTKAKVSESGGAVAVKDKCGDNDKEVQEGGDCVVDGRQTSNRGAKKDKKVLFSDENCVVEEWDSSEADEEEVLGDNAGSAAIDLLGGNWRSGCDRETSEGSGRSEDLDAERYFPDDGYNYEVHLRQTGCGGGGVFIAHEENVKTKKRERVQEADDDDLDAVTIELRKTAEGRELLGALNASLDSAVAAGDELEDNFVFQAHDCDNSAMRDMMWGSHVVTTDDTHLSLSREERTELLKNFKSIQNEDEDDEAVRKPRPNGGVEDELVSKFERLMAEEYNEDEIGDLASDDEAVLRNVNADVSHFRGVINDFISVKNDQNRRLGSKVKAKYKTSDPQDDHGFVPPNEATLLITRALIEAQSDEQLTSTDTSDDDSDGHDRQGWDCETILTTRSTLFHHPSKISRPPSAAPSTIRLASKLKLPIDYLPTHLQKKILTLSNNTNSTTQRHQRPSKMMDGKAIPEANDELVDIPNFVNIRPKEETTEARRERKKNVKTAQRIIRQLKKKNVHIQKEVSKAECDKMSQRNAYDIRDGVRRIRYT